MSLAQSNLIHPTAIISPDAELDIGVKVGPYAIIEGKVRIGPGCEIQAHACLYGDLTLGRGNVVHAGAVLGDEPQHLKYDGEPTRVEIGDFNTFRENATVNRGTAAAGVTRIGDYNFFMAGAHVGHDCTVGNNCILANNALLGGHCVVGDAAFISGNAAVHQFSRIGRLSLLSGCSGATKDIPPFIMQRGFNLIVGVNVVGMRRAGLSPDQISGVRQAYRVLFRDSLTLPVALAKLEAELGDIDTVQELIAFMRGPGRGVNMTHSRSEAA
jgi:UDP-N-acetylglucosamine acyltransferase